MANTRRRWLFRLVALAIAGAASLVTLEVGLRVASPPPLFHAWLPAYPNQREERISVDLAGVSPQSTRTTNAWGLRGDPPPEVWEAQSTLLTIGGSTTQCYYLDDTLTWPHLLQEHLQTPADQVWVGNAGFDGHSTRGHLLVMEYIVGTLRPDAVVFLVGANDLALSISPEYREQRYDDQNYMSRFRTVQLLSLWKQILVDDAVVVQGSGHGGLRRRPLDPASAAPLPEDLREALPSLPEFRANLERLITMARRQEVAVLFMTQPMLFEDTPEWQALEGSAYWIDSDQRISAATYRRLMDVFNDELRAVCAEQDVPCFDLAAALGSEEAYYYDMIHFSEAGAARVAALAAEAVRDARLLVR